MEENIEIHERITRVETKVDAILENHLPHIQMTINKVDERLWWILATVIVGSVLGIAVQFIK